MNRRNFLHQMGLAVPAVGLAAMAPEALSLKSCPEISELQVAEGDDFWNGIKSSFTVSPNIINLNNGGVSPQPIQVQNAHIRFYQYSNEAPSYYMWRILDQGRESLRAQLAKIAGCETEEIAINRNATEGLNSVIFGLNLAKGDEVILGKYDYPNMMNAWKQREKREGIVLKWVELDLPSENPQAITDAYVAQFSSRTKVIHLTHMINWNGQILPVADIARKARARGIEVIVDAAHSFGHIDFNIPDLECDYLATSLHKWLCAPFGSGLLYVRKEKISNVWALLSSTEPDGPDIRKFESLGTRSFASEMAIGTAIDFHEMIGAKRKAERLTALRLYWMKQAQGIKGLKFYTSMNPEYSCAIGVVGAEGRELSELDQYLFNKKGIHAVAINIEKITGMRITPHVYTSFGDLDRLLEGLNDFVRS